MPINIPKDTQLLALTLHLQPHHTSPLYPQYTIGLHAWFLDQVRQTDPTLSATLHDDQTEKAFTLSPLQGNLLTQSQTLHIQAEQPYTFTLTALTKPIAQWIAQWLTHLPAELAFCNAPLTITHAELTLPPTTYKKLWQQPPQRRATLSFTTPTSFRRKGQHFPLPLPTNVFHSYLRRWNSFAHLEYDSDEFLAWVDDSILIDRHRLESTKVTAGKKGTVTAFTGAIEYSISPKATSDEEYEQLFSALIRLAPYCGTGHKTTFGLGQTCLGWHDTAAPELPSTQILITERIAELTAIFIAQRSRTGGDRATYTAETWATILARRELGESLMAIAADLEMPYETVKTYAKLARQSLK
jgi:CRISPR-associated endoribonuclease Cas6